MVPAEIGAALMISTPGALKPERRVHESADCAPAHADDTNTIQIVIRQN
jgi:hypothetical protein